MASRSGTDPGHVILAQPNYPAKIYWNVTVVDGDLHLAPAAFIDAITTSVDHLVANGVPLAEVRVGLDYDREPDYGDDRIITKVKVIGSRPATRDEVATEERRRQVVQRSERDDEKARLRQRLSELDRT